MTRPESLFEQASYDLNKFRERRIAERRAQLRNTPDRRASPKAHQTGHKHDNSASDAGKDAG